MNETTNKNHRLLLVDDDDALRTALTKLLHKEGYSVNAQPDAISALNHLTASGEKFDLVITDVSMPGIKGIKLLSILKAKFPDLPVIIITAFGDWGEYGEALHKGATEYLCKPLELDEFLDAVSRALNPQRRAVGVSPAFDPW